MTGVHTQTKINLSLTTKLGKDKLLVESFEGTEGLDELFRFTLNTYAVHPKNKKHIDLKFKQAMQKDATLSLISLKKQGKKLVKKQRYISGIITSITQGPTVGYQKKTKQKKHERTYFQVVIEPQAHLMSLNEDCRVFQNKNAITIIKSVLKEHKVKIEDKTSKCGKTKRDMCVQYNESDFAFVSRLMEEEGIYYFFTHTKAKHTMVLCDGSKPYKKCPELSDLNVAPAKKQIGLYNLRIQESLVPSSYTTKDFNFIKPKTSLKAKAKGKAKAIDQYHYPGNYIKKPDGKKVATRRLNAGEGLKHILSGDTHIPFILPGHSFKLKNCLRKEFNNKEFLFFRAWHRCEMMHEDNDETYTDYTSAENDFVYSNTSEFFLKKTKYAPAQKTPRPHIFGTQTATVSGKKGEEIWTDKYGRVRIKFHWDIGKTKNEKTSCWVRVNQFWTGKKWGMQFIPRIGQEVIISYINGNPDQPLVTGCVYNGVNLPPYLPKDATKSTIKTHSSKKAKGFNELSFEDKKDKEELYMHAQKDFTVDVLNGHRKVTIHGKKKGGNDTLLLKKGNRKTTLKKGNDTLLLTKGNRKITLKKGNITEDVNGNITHKVKKNYTLDIGGNLIIKVKKNIKISNKAKFTLESKGPAAITAAKLDVKAKAAIALKAAMLTTNVKAMTTFKSGMMTIKGKGPVKLDAGLLTIKSKGPAQMEGALVTIKAKAMMTVKGNAMATFQGGAMATLKGGGMASVKGALVMLG